MSGIELARTFYVTEVAPLLAGVPHAAALLGTGSEVLGFDDDVSPDHDFGPRVQVYAAGEVPPLPAAADIRPLAEVSAAPMGVADWLLTPTQVLATRTAGAVFHDPDGVLARYRAGLRWYPDDVWRYALAAGWLRVAQEEPFVARTASTGDDLGSRVIAARLVRDLMRLCFLVGRRWAPYPKWFGRAFAALPTAARVGPLLTAAVSAGHWREREQALGAAAVLVAAATNELGLCPPVEATLRQFHDRDIRVLGAERFTVALTAAITDPQLRALIDRVGYREGVGRLPGTIDQVTDSTDVLTSAGRCRAAAPLLGLVSDSCKTSPAVRG